jgi:hypothetical protein
MTKTSAGCSMTENTNDLGHMHDGLHKLFASKDFKCKEVPDPPGTLYATLKNYLSKNLTPASFRTFWKCICQMEPFMLKAFTPMNVLSALKIGGFEGDKINIKSIMEHNFEFVNIQPAEKAEEILQLIETEFADYWWNHGLIHESVFDEIFEDEEDIDTHNQPRVGKALNYLPTNRQRFMMDNHDCWKEEIRRRQEVEDFSLAEKESKRIEREIAEAARPDKFRSCCQPGCPMTIDITTSALKKVNERLWKKCSGKGCRFWCCTDHLEVIHLHQLTCKK